MITIVLLGGLLKEALVERPVVEEASLVGDVAASLPKVVDVTVPIHEGVDVK